MKNLKTKLAMAFALIGFSFAAQAENLKPGGLFIEPMLTYQKADTKQNWSQTFGGLKDATGHMDGLGLGMRLGGHVSEIVFLGADLRYSMLKMESSDVGKADAYGYNYGAVLGAQMPWYGLRLWGTYVIGGAFDPKKTDKGADVKLDDQRGYRLGAGIKLASVSLNIEYEDTSYSKASVQDAGGFSLLNKDFDTTQKAWIASVSFPIAL